ncbi:MAG: hypothetical protein ACHQLA_01210 [Ignavibacteriales bacterium]
MKKFLRLIQSASIIYSVFSCSPSTQFSDIYADESFIGKELKKILVVGAAKEEWKRKVYENEFRSRLMFYNVEVLTAWQEIPKGQELNKDTFEKYFKDKNVDAVLVIIAAGESTFKTMYSGASSNVYVGFYGFYFSTASVYYNAGYMAEETIVHMGTNLYETKEGKLIWSAKSQSYEPENTGDVVKTVSNNVVNELNRQGFIK